MMNTITSLKGQSKKIWIKQELHAKMGMNKTVRYVLPYRKMQILGLKDIILNIWRSYDVLILPLKWSSLYKHAKCLSYLF